MENSENMIMGSNKIKSFMDQKFLQNILLIILKNFHLKVIYLEEKKMQ
jgi:hypothetical protein